MQKCLLENATDCLAYCLKQAYFSKWSDAGIVNLKEEFSKLIALTAARTLLGREIREQLFDEVSLATNHSDLQHCC